MKENSGKIFKSLIEGDAVNKLLELSKLSPEDRGDGVLGDIWEASSGTATGGSSDPCKLSNVLAQYLQKTQAVKH
ncbi:hypothetical protein [Pseudomonas sp. H3_H05]